MLLLFLAGFRCPKYDARIIPEIRTLYKLDPAIG
jgi:hypothetical protein